jgi:DNA-binding response OmpR family regulator
MSHKEKITKIMVVDDNEDIRDSLSIVLREKGFVVETAINGREALEKALIFRPEIIIIDAMMPVMDGFETCRRLRENIRTKNISLILATSTAIVDIADKEIDIDDYINKPYELDELYSKIERLLHTK